MTITVEKLNGDKVKCSILEAIPFNTDPMPKAIIDPDDTRYEGEVLFNGIRKALKMHRAEEELPETFASLVE